jgi:hypothetical protein
MVAIDVTDLAVASSPQYPPKLVRGRRDGYYVLEDSHISRRLGIRLEVDRHYGPVYSPSVSWGNRVNEESCGAYGCTD